MFLSLPHLGLLSWWLCSFFPLNFHSCNSNSFCDVLKGYTAPPLPISLSSHTRRNVLSYYVYRRVNRRPGRDSLEHSHLCILLRIVRVVSLAARCVAALTPPPLQQSINAGSVANRSSSHSAACCSCCRVVLLQPSARCRSEFDWFSILFSKMLLQTLKKRAKWCRSGIKLRGKKSESDR